MHEFDTQPFIIDYKVKAVFTLRESCFKLWNPNFFTIVYVLF